MSGNSIHCTHCGDSFERGKKYNEHNCVQREYTSMQIKSEPEEQEDHDEDDNLLQLTSDEISGELINIKTENVEKLDDAFMNDDGDDSLRECEQEDPLGFSTNIYVNDNVDNAEVETNVPDNPISIEGNVRNRESSVVKKNNKSVKSLPYKYLEDYSCQCKLCDKVCPSREEILKHFNESHKSYRPFECGVCGKKFVHKHYVNLHMRVHTGERPYVCQLCPRSYSHKTSFTIHMRIHNGIRPYACECSICGIYCATQASITGHINLHHYNLKPDSEPPPPEKTLVKDSTSGILGTKAPEPRSLYRLASQITGSGEKFIHTPKARAPRLISTINSRISTRIIEVTSKDTPISIPSNTKKSTSKKINCVLPKQTPSLDSEENKAMSYQEFLNWQERMLTNQGLIVKGYSSATNENHSTSSSNAGTTTTITSTNVATSSSKKPGNSNIKNTQTPASSSPSLPKQQYLLLSQTTDGNSTKILLPLGMMDQGQNGKQMVPLNLPTILSSNSGSTTAGAQGSRPLIFLPQATNNQPLLLLSNGGQKMLLMPSQNISKTTPTNSQTNENKILPKVEIKKELEDNIFAPEMTIKTEHEPLTETSTTDFQSSIKIKDEPQSYDESSQ
ncbi:Zinc finger protein [Armadillidium nasatum]|uniref:Zinc finger protein n=1 Tax=Armadillidium nasatum TaxID=96803 RepID=A0A5N5TA84_9CRUS|nr:Zinc finger protein [Armadillidium nasatum]